MDQLVDAHVLNCSACAANADTSRPTPLIMSPLPDAPWQELSADLYGPLRSGHHLLVVLDEYSRYPFVRKITATTARAIVPIFDELFALFGVAERVKSDNAPPFDSNEFARYAAATGFVHRRITPHYPQANGMCERFVANLGNVMQGQLNWQQLGS